MIGTLFTIFMLILLAVLAVNLVFFGLALIAQDQEERRKKNGQVNAKSAREVAGPTARKSFTTLNVLNVMELAGFIKAISNGLSI